MVNYSNFDDNSINNYFNTIHFAPTFEPFNFYSANNELYSVPQIQLFNPAPSFLTADFDSTNNPFILQNSFNTDLSLNNLWFDFNNIFSFPSTGDIFNFNNTFNSFPIGDTFNFSTTGVSKNSSVSNTTKTYTGTLKDYNPEAGKKLVDIASHNAHYYINKRTRQITSSTKNPYKFTSNCARYVKIALRDSGLGEYYEGHAYQMADKLRKNPNFKEISPSSVNVKDLPAGCILVFDRGKSGYSSTYGHVEYTKGNGEGVSDGITRNLRQPSAIFIPV